jgi:hypothetical protein
MTTLEIQVNATGPVRVPALITESLISSAQESRLVVDCPAYAWDNSDQQAILDLRNTFGDDLVDTYETDLRHAAHKLIETHLDAAWGNRDFAVSYVRNASAFEDGATPGPDGTEYFVPSDETYHQVWQTAADAITDKDLVHEADLQHVFRMGTELQQHRAALLHRLNEFAETANCDKAEAQLDGYREAVEAAVTRAQLVEISSLIA